MESKAHDKPRFSELGIAKNFLAILEGQRFIHPTPIQRQVIPVALDGKDVVGIAQTGTGKTLAFGIPMIQRLAVRKGQGLVVVPTRELALQVDEVLRAVGKALGVRNAVLIGGAPLGPQIKQLAANPHIVVATPGRLADHLKQKNYSLKSVSVIVLDEADRMLDIGFLPEIKRILSLAPRDRQTMLFSATMPDAIAQIAAQYMKLPLRIEVAPAGTSAKNVEQEIFILDAKDKPRLLEKLLFENQGSVLVFSRTKHGAKKIARALRAIGQQAAELHSNRSQNQRRDALDGFKSGKYRILVATDIAARGIDVQGISLVVNYDLPDNSEDYVHRIGRTGRAGNSGKAISFATQQQRGDIKHIERLIRKTIPILGLPDLPPPRARVEEKTRPSGFSHSRQSRGFGHGIARAGHRNSGHGRGHRVVSRGGRRQD